MALLPGKTRPSRLVGERLGSAKARALRTWRGHTPGEWQRLQELESADQGWWRRDAAERAASGEEPGFEVCKTEACCTGGRSRSGSSTPR
jgi:hypothetical protein